MRLVGRVTTLCMLVAVLVSSALGAQEANVPVQDFELDNGMKLLFVERHDNPTVSAGWLADVGSANESYGVTGMAHLFEHMMFKGTQTIGTSDWEQEKGIMAQLDEVRQLMEGEYSALREAKRRGEITGSIYLPENQTPRLAELREKMKALQEQQRELIVKDEYDQVYTGSGASGINAGTGEDFTIYFLTVPANKLELWFWMESERLLNSVFREFYSERDVVREERRARVESDPVAKYQEQFEAMFWASYPYHHPITGWPTDVESIGRAEADRFFATYYAPNNITAALVGDFDPQQALRLAKKYFGRIPRGSQDPPEVVTEGLEQLQPKRMHARADTNPSVSIRWHTVPFVHSDSYPLRLLSSILNGRTGRLYKALVEEKEIASGEPGASVDHRKYAGLFEVSAELVDGATHDQVEAALLAELERIKKEPVGERELQKVKNQSLANSFRRLQSNFFVVLQLLVYESRGEWSYINDSPAKLQAVTAEDIMRVAKTYFTPEGLNVLWYSRKEGTEEDPALAALPPDKKAGIKMMLAQIKQIDQPEQLQMVLAQMKGAAGQVPAEERPAFELVIRTVEERLQELGAPAGEEQ